MVKGERYMGYETLLVWFTGVVAVSTVFYVILTGLLAIETRKTRMAYVEPRVSVRVELSLAGDFGYELVLSNEGQGVARDVQFKFEGDPSYFRKSFVRGVTPTVDQLPVIRDGLDYLEPGQTWRFPIGTVSEDEFERAAKAPWVFHVRYKNLFGKRRSDTHQIEFSLLRGTFFVPNRLKEISQHLDSIRKDLNRLTEGFSKVHIVTESKESFLKDREGLLSRHEDGTKDEIASSGKDEVT